MNGVLDWKDILSLFLSWAEFAVIIGTHGSVGAAHFTLNQDLTRPWRLGSVMLGD